MDFVPPDLEFVPRDFDFIPAGFDFVRTDFELLPRVLEVGWAARVDRFGVAELQSCRIWLLHGLKFVAVAIVAQAVMEMGQIPEASGGTPTAISCCCRGSSAICPAATRTLREGSLPANCSIRSASSTPRSKTTAPASRLEQFISGPARAIGRASRFGPNSIRRDRLDRRHRKLRRPLRPRGRRRRLMRMPRRSL